MDCEQEVIEIRDDAPGAPGISFGDVIKYWSLVEKVIAALKALTVDVGGSVDLGWTRIRFKGATYRWDMGKITRES